MKNLGPLAQATAIFAFVFFVAGLIFAIYWPQDQVYWLFLATAGMFFIHSFASLIYNLIKIKVSRRK